MTARDLTDVVLGYAPLAGEVKGDENGFLYGDPETEITGVAVCWTPSADVLRRAAADGLNYILSHEILWFPRAEVEWFATLPEAERPHNRVRKELMDRHGLVHCRCHSNWDPIVNEGIADSCARELGFPEPVYRSRYLRMYELPPLTLAELADQVKARLGVPQVRVAGDLWQVVRKVGIAYGGFGQNWQCLDEYVTAGADAVILGEAIDYTLRAGVDAGIGLIEASHIGTENPGMRNFARILAERLPQLPVKFLDAGHCWVNR